MATKTELAPRAEREAQGNPSDLSSSAVDEIAKALNAIVADTFTLYVKTKNFHWHMSGRHFRDYHLMLDEQADQILAAIDPMAERVRKLGRLTIHSIGEIEKARRLQDNDSSFVTPSQMLAELREDNASCAASMREAHRLCEDSSDSATAGLLETLIDEAERRSWFLFETAGGAHPASKPPH